MKKVLFAMAIAGMFGFVACNNNKTEEAIDSTVENVEAMAEENVENAVEEIVDSAAAEVATEVAAQ